MKIAIALIGLILIAAGCEPLVDNSKTTNVGGNGNVLVEQSGTSNVVQNANEMSAPVAPVSSTNDETEAQ